MMFDFFRKSSCLPTSLIVAGAMLLSACGSKNQDKPEYVMRQIADEAAPRFVVAPKVESFSQDQVTVSFGIDELGEAVVLLTPKQ